MLGEADAARFANAFEARGDIDAVAHQIAVALLYDVAQMDADAELDAALGRQAGIALDHAVLHLDGAAHRVDNAAELDEAPIAGALDHATMMHGDRRIDQIAAQRPQPRQDAILVRAGEPAVADHIRDQDRRDFSGLTHLLPFAACTTTRTKVPCPNIERLRQSKIVLSRWLFVQRLHSFETMLVKLELAQLGAADLLNVRYWDAAKVYQMTDFGRQADVRRR